MADSIKVDLEALRAYAKRVEQGANDAPKEAEVTHIVGPTGGIPTPYYEEMADTSKKLWMAVQRAEASLRSLHGALLNTIDYMSGADQEVEDAAAALALTLEGIPLLAPATSPSAARPTGTIK